MVNKFLESLVGVEEGNLAEEYEGAMKKTITPEEVGGKDQELESIRIPTYQKQASNFNNQDR
jgi:hypothetical protein